MNRYGVRRMGWLGWMVLVSLGAWNGSMIPGSSGGRILADGEIGQTRPDGVVVYAHSIGDGDGTTRPENAGDPETAKRAETGSPDRAPVVARAGNESGNVYEKARAVTVDAPAQVDREGTDGNVGTEPPFRWAFYWREPGEETDAIDPLNGRVENLLTDSETDPANRIRVTGNSPMFHWAAPVVTGTNGAVDPALRSIDVGYHGNPVVYEIPVEPGETYRLIAGVCEGHHQEAGQRIVRFVIDGREVGTLDTMRDGRNVPLYESFSVTDDDQNGMIRFEVGTTSDSPDRNSILNVLWILPGDAAQPSRESLVAG
ncbi:MAG: hypothetical protein Q4C47_03540, partial [Planctomycetia bacterium]|nr:hypothetical protein [Planctomycetia bacterium]